MRTDHTDRAESMLKQMGECDSIEQDHKQVPSYIQAELQGIYQAIEQAQSADQIREKFTRNRENKIYESLDKKEPAATNTKIEIPSTMTANSINRRNQRIARYAITAAAVMFIGIGSVVSSAFFSADMARTLKQLPGTSQFYQLTSQWGWVTADKQEVVSPQPSVEQNGITLILRSLLYDGKKVKIELEQQAQKQRGIQQIEIYANGRKISTSDNKINKNNIQDANTSIYTLQRELHPAHLLGVTDEEIYQAFGQLVEVPVSELPKQVDVQIKITLQGMTDKPFIYDMHTERLNSLPNYSLSHTLRTPEGLGYHRATVETTPINTYVELGVSYSDQWEKWRYNYYLKEGNYPSALSYSLTDSEHRIYRTYSHSGDKSHEYLEFDPIIGQPDELIITPWNFNEEPILHHREVPIHPEKDANIPLALDMGTTGKVKLLQVDSTPDQYILRIQPEQAYQTYTIASSFWYGKLNQRHEIYPTEMLPDPSHQGQILVKFDKSKLEAGDQLYYSIDKVSYKEPLHLKRS